MSHAAEGATKKYEFIRLTSATSLLPNKLRSCLIPLRGMSSLRKLEGAAVFTPSPPVVVMGSSPKVGLKK